MGLGDKLKGLRDQAQHTVADNRDKIQGAVQSVGEAANARTGGKYADKIERVGEKLSAGVDKLGGAASEGDAGAPDTGSATPGDSAPATGPAAAGESAPASSADEPGEQGRAGPPEFE